MPKILGNKCAKGTERRPEDLGGTFDLVHKSNVPPVDEGHKLQNLCESITQAPSAAEASMPELFDPTCSEAAGLPVLWTPPTTMKEKFRPTPFKIRECPEPVLPVLPELTETVYDTTKRVVRRGAVSGPSSSEKAKAVWNPADSKKKAKGKTVSPKFAVRENGESLEIKNTIGPVDIDVTEYDMESLTALYRSFDTNLLTEEEHLQLEDELRDAQKKKLVQLFDLAERGNGSKRMIIEIPAKLLVRKPAKYNYPAWWPTEFPDAVKYANTTPVPPNTSLDDPNYTWCCFQSGLTYPRGLAKITIKRLHKKDYAEKNGEVYTPAPPLPPPKGKPGRKPGQCANGKQLARKKPGPRKKAAAKKGPPLRMQPAERKTPRPKPRTKPLTKAAAARLAKQIPEDLLKRCQMRSLSDSDSEFESTDVSKITRK